MNPWRRRSSNPHDDDHEHPGYEGQPAPREGPRGARDDRGSFGARSSGLPHTSGCSGDTLREDRFGIWKIQERRPGPFGRQTESWVSIDREPYVAARRDTVATRDALGFGCRLSNCVHSAQRRGRGRVRGGGELGGVSRHTVREMIRYRSRHPGWPNMRAKTNA